MPDHTGTGIGGMPTTAPTTTNEWGQQQPAPPSLMGPTGGGGPMMTDSLMQPYQQQQLGGSAFPPTSTSPIPPAQQQQFPPLQGAGSFAAPQPAFSTAQQPVPVPPPAAGLQASQLQQLQAQQAQAQQLAQQQTWLQQADQHLAQQVQQGQNVYDPLTGRMTAANQNQPQSSPVPPHSTQSEVSQYQQQQILNQQQQQLMGTGAAGSGLHPAAAPGAAGAKGAGSISGLLADFSRALGMRIRR